MFQKLLLLLLLAGLPARGDISPSYITFPSDIDWVCRDSEHFQILYRRGEAHLAERALRAAERAHQLLVPIFKETPPKTWDSACGLSRFFKRLRH